jgi:hypothetical protein
LLFCGDLTILLLGLAFHCFVIEKENRYATALAGHRAAILFNPSLYNWDRFAVVEVVDYGIY